MMLSAFPLRSLGSGAGEWGIGDGWLDRIPSRTCEAKVFWFRLLLIVGRNRGLSRDGPAWTVTGFDLITGHCWLIPGSGHR